jgi:hypothetical protein
MRCKFIRAGAAIVVAARILAASVPQAKAVSYWNEPGNFCQCLGYGDGAGYHAPLILGPPEHCGWLTLHEVRLACPPGPPNYYYNCGGSCGGGESDQTLLEPAAPVSQPQPTPASAALWSPVAR